MIILVYLLHSTEFFRFYTIDELTNGFYRINAYYSSGGAADSTKPLETLPITTITPEYGVVDRGDDANGRHTSIYQRKTVGSYSTKEWKKINNTADELGKKDITDEEAKNLLKNYINAKCK